MQSTRDGRDLHVALRGNGIQIRRTACNRPHWKRMSVGYEISTGMPLVVAVGLTQQAARSVAMGVRGPRGAKHIFNPTVHVRYSRRGDDGTRIKQCEMNFYVNPR
jgi:hypothetical protein